MAKRERIKPDQEHLVQPVSTTGETVTVGCKLPHGLMLQLYEMELVSVPIMGGGYKDVEQAKVVGEAIRINGFANEVNKPPKSLTYGGFGMTYGVPKHHLEAWLEANQDSEVVRKGLIFAIGGDHEDAHAEGVDRKASKSGFESIDPTVPLRVGPFNVEQARVNTDAVQQGVR